MLVFAVIAIGMVTGCGRRELSEAEVSQLQQLRVEKEALRSEIEAGEKDKAKYDEGLLSLLIATRLEVARVTLALIDQRIQSVEAGAPVTITTSASAPDEARATRLSEEIAKEEVKLATAEKEASKYSGGLLQVMALTTAATSQQTLAMLRQQMLVAKYGLALPKAGASAKMESKTSDAPPPSAAPKSDPMKDAAGQILAVEVLRKKESKINYQDFILLDLQFTATGLDRKARAIKGVLNFTDLFDEPKFHLTWSIDKPIAPGEVREEKGGGFEYNQFNDAQQWVRATDLSSMKVNYTVKSILYEDGTRRDLE